MSEKPVAGPMLERDGVVAVACDPGPWSRRFARWAPVAVGAALDDAPVLVAARARAVEFTVLGVLAEVKALGWAVVDGPAVTLTDNFRGCMAGMGGPRAEIVLVEVNALDLVTPDPIPELVLFPRVSAWWARLLRRG